MDRINILIVDDREENLISLTAILDNPEYRLVKALSGSEALRALMKEDFALILLDVQMPIMDGFETAQAIKQREKTRSVPIIFITANSVDDPFVYKGYSAGAVDYMMKPFNPDVLRSKVAVFADLHRKNLQLKKQSEVMRLNEKLEHERDVARREMLSLRREQMAHQKYRDLVDDLHHGIVWISDPDMHTFSFVSGQAEQILGYPASHWMKERDFWFHHLCKEDHEPVRELLRQCAAGEVQSPTVEHRLVKADGKTMWFQTGVRLVAGDDGHRPELRGLSVDITHLKEAQARAQEAISVRDEFLSIASHELKTPLTSLNLQIQSMRRLLVRSAQDAQVALSRLPRVLESSEHQVKRLGKLVEELLDVARINHGKIILENEAFDLAELVRDVCARHHHELGQAGCAISLDVPDAVPGCWDRLRVEQIFINLLTNAIKYGAGKPIDVKVKCEDKGVLMQVRDHGIGIAKEDQKRIFSQYERAVSSSNFGGLGLGLYIVSQIVEAHGGTIAVESEPGAGSVFTVRLPLEFEVTTPGRQMPKALRAAVTPASTTSGTTAGAAGAPAHIPLAATARQDGAGG